jgi:stage V sporulation protein S
VGIEIVCAPSFADININGENRTAIRFTVEPRYLRGTKKAELGEDAKYAWDAYGANFSES